MPATGVVRAGSSYLSDCSTGGGGGSGGSGGSTVSSILW